MSLDLSPTKAYSTASIGKAYLDAMGIRPPAIDPDPVVGLAAEAVHGAAMQAYYGGRTECRIRRVPVPVVYLDFLSMYPTVNANMGLWRYLTADRLRVVDATDEVTAFLASVTLEDLFHPATWQRLPALVQIVPDDDVLPVRGRWNLAEQSWQIGVNHLTCSEPLWYTLADAVAAKLLGGKAPRVARAIRFLPEGRQRLRPVRLRGEVPIDPMRQDFFRLVIEERARIRARIKTASDAERAELDRLQMFLKILANSASYGVFAEMNQEDEPAECTVWTGEPEPFSCTVPHPEALGRYCCPPLAALITGAARLMLAMLERSVTDLGGSYAMCDTDSMAVVATEPGGPVPCPGGPARLPDGREAVRAQSLAQVDGIVQRFAALSPYDRKAVPESIVKVEDENFTLCGVDGHDRDRFGRPKQCVCTKVRRELWCYAISAKRYALSNRDEDGAPLLRKWSEHGLGHLLNPTDPDSDDRDWMKQVWINILQAASGLPTQPPPWLDLPAAARTTVSTWELCQRFSGLDPTGRYAERVKPGNFLLVFQTDSYLGRAGQERARPVLVAPYETDSRMWAGLTTIDRKTGELHPITTDDRYADSHTIRVKSYREVLEDHRQHPEAKSLAPDGQPCRQETIGLLGRRPVLAASISHVGKETNKLEEVMSGEEDDPDKVYAEYERPGATLDVLRRLLRGLPRGSTAREAGISWDTLTDIVEGRSSPHSSTQETLERIVRRHLLAELDELGAYERGTGLLPLPSLAGIHAVALDAARWEVWSALRTLRDHVGQARAAAVCGMPRGTFERRLDAFETADVKTIAVLRHRLRPHRRALGELARLDSELSSLEVEIGALREAIASDPHTPYLDWLDRTHILYDRQAWLNGRLRPVRNPVTGTRAGWHRRETVYCSDILDREAQQLGEHIDGFMDRLDQLRRSRSTCAELLERRDALRAKLLQLGDRLYT